MWAGSFWVMARSRRKHGSIWLPEPRPNHDRSRPAAMRPRQVAHDILAVWPRLVKMRQRVDRVFLRVDWRNPSTVMFRLRPSPSLSIRRDMAYRLDDCLDQQLC